MNRILNIIVVEASPIISRGLGDILTKSKLNCQISFVESLEEIELLRVKTSYEFIIVNPSFIQNNTKTFNSIRNHFENVRWVGLIYAYYDPNLLSIFDALITISDTPESIISSLNKLLTDNNPHGQNSSYEILSEREIDVLKLLATGMANKEIADNLNISTNTVITHRKNISQKTGIKSVSGLTIYAVVQELVSIEKLIE